jgi:MarR family 2-MHQ and catechol resistance regulon transcriptional repressor
MKTEILDYLSLLRDFGRLYTQKILTGNTRQKTDLKLSQVKAMYAFRDADSLSAKELAGLVGTKLCTATVMCDSLEQEGIVTRQRDAADRRKVMVTLTPKGKKFRKDFLTHRHRIARKIFSHISSNEQARLQQALCTVCEILQHAFEYEMPVRSKSKKGGGLPAVQPVAKSKKTASNPVTAKG